MADELEIVFEKKTNNLTLKLNPSKTRNRFFHEVLIYSIGNHSMTENQLLEKFPEYSYILGQVLQREIETGKIKSYKRKGKKYFRATVRGTNIINLERKNKFMFLGK